MGCNYECFKLKNNYRGISCKPCDKESALEKPHPPCNPRACEEKFVMEIARAVGNMLQCMACSRGQCCEGGITVKIVDQCTRVPISNVEVAIMCNGIIIAKTWTCDKGLARFNGLCKGCYTVFYQGAPQPEIVELTNNCPYVMIVIAQANYCLC